MFSDTVKTQDFVLKSHVKKNIYILETYLELKTKYQNCTYTHIRTQPELKFQMIGWLVISVYLSSLPVADLSDAPPGRRLVVKRDSTRI